MNIYPVAGKRKSSEICEAFAAGGDSDADVFYGVDKSNLTRWNATTEFWYIDNSYLDATRGTHFRVTKNALQHSGIGESDGSRFKALDIPIEAWKDGGEHIVVCPQSDSFMRDLIGYEGDWLWDTANELKKVSPRKLRIRSWDRDKMKLAESLPTDLEGAWALVTYSSAAAVTAALMGVPIVATGYSAATPISTCIESIEAPRKPAREGWSAVLADNQFTLEEMRSGEAWKMLHEG